MSIPTQNKECYAGGILAVQSPFSASKDGLVVQMQHFDDTNRTVMLALPSATSASQRHNWADMLLMLLSVTWILVGFLENSVDYILYTNGGQAFCCVLAGESTVRHSCGCTNCTVSLHRQQSMAACSIE